MQTTTQHSVQITRCRKRRCVFWPSVQLLGWYVLLSYSAYSLLKDSPGKSVGRMAVMLPAEAIWWKFYAFFQLTTMSSTWTTHENWSKCYWRELSVHSGFMACKRIVTWLVLQLMRDVFTGSSVHSKIIY